MEYGPGSARLRPSTSSATTRRNVGGPPRPPTSVGQPYRIQPASYISRRIRPICSMWPASE